MGLGFTWALTLIGAIREILGFGSIFNIKLVDSAATSDFSRSHLVLVTVGILIAGMNMISARLRSQLGGEKSMELFYIFIGAVLLITLFCIVSGICPSRVFLNKLKRLWYGTGDHICQVVSAALTWLLQWFVLNLYSPFLQTDVFILSIA